MRKQIKDGRLRGLAIADGTRSKFLPDLPTSIELGNTALIATNWTGLLAPANTPQPVIDKLHAAVIEIMKSPHVREVLTSAAVDIQTSPSPADFQKYIAAEYGKWGKLVKETGVKGGD